MPTTILDGETYTEALQRRYAEEATRDLAHVVTNDPLYQQGFVDGVEEGRRQIEEAEQREWVEPSDAQLDAICEPFGTFIECARAVLKLAKELNK